MIYNDVCIYVMRMYILCVTCMCIYIYIHKYILYTVYIYIYIYTCICNYMYIYIDMPRLPAAPPGPETGPNDCSSGY